MPDDRPEHLTQAQKEQLEAELSELEGPRRAEVVQAIKTERGFGDLSENFEYHSAKNEQGFIESRIQELEQIVKNHRLIEAGAPSGVVRLGSTVRFNEDGGPEESYRIVGPAEADPAQGRVSNESAMGRALLGGKAGEEVEVVTDSGSSYRVKILAIE